MGSLAQTTIEETQETLENAGNTFALVGRADCRCSFSQGLQQLPELGDGASEEGDCQCQPETSAPVV